MKKDLLLGKTITGYEIKAGEETGRTWKIIFLLSEGVTVEITAEGVRDPSLYMTITETEMQAKG